MEHLNEDKAKIFDDFYSNNQLTLLKIFSFFMDEKQRPLIALFIKYMELNICVQKSMRRHEIPPSCNFGNKKPDLEDILCELEDYLPKEYHGMMEQVKNMKENMEMYSQMMEMMNMMNETQQNNCDNMCRHD